MNFFKKKELAVLFAVFLLALFLRVYKLGTLPAGFYEEEVTNAYVGRFILQNGVDLYCNRFPLLYFDKFGDYPPVLPLYLSGLSTFIFGFTEFAARFPIALIGALTIFPLYGLSMLLFRSKWWAIFSAFLFAILPWHIVLSRTTAEGVVGLSVYVWGLWLLWKGIEKHDRCSLLWSAGLLFLTYFLYPAFRLIVPLTLLPMIFLLTSNREVKKYLTVATIAFIALTIGIAATAWGRGRFLQTSFFHSDWAATHVGIRNQMFSYGEGAGNELLARTFHNKLIGYSRLFVEEYIRYFSPKHLLLDAEGQPRYFNVPGHGWLYVTIGILLVFGLLIREKSKTNSKLVNLMVYLLFIAPLPAALTVDFPPHVHRAITMTIPYAILASVGAANIVSLGGKYWKSVVVSIIVVALVLETIYFWHQYDRHEASHQSILRNGADREVVKYLIAHQKEYDMVAAPIMERIPIYYLYFSKNLDRGLAGKFGNELQIPSIDNISFVADWCPSKTLTPEQFTKKLLVVDRVECAEPDALKVVDMFYRRDSTGAYKISVTK